MKTIDRRLFVLALCAATPALAQSGAPQLTINLESSSIGRRIELGQPRFRAAGRYQMVEVQAQNVSSRDQTIEYKIDWFDREGFSVQTTSTWQSLRLSPNAYEAIRSVGQTDTAHSARLTIRDAN